MTRIELRRCNTAYVKVKCLRAIGDRYAGKLRTVDREVLNAQVCHTGDPAKSAQVNFFTDLVRVEVRN